MANITGNNPPVLNDTDYVDKIKNSLDAIDDHDHTTGKGVAIGTSALADGSVTSAKIADGTIVNDDINASAAIAHTKLANITAGQVLLGNASNVPTATALSGDVTVNSSGVTAISTGVIVNADVNASAAIDRTKIASGTADHVLINNGSGVMSSESALAITRGGTGQSTANAGFNALSPMTTKGDLISYSTTAARVGVGTDGQVLTADSAETTGVKWATAASAPDSSYELSNLSIAASVGSSALTVALKDKTGSDPSGGSPVKIGFRNSTSSTGTYNQRSVTSALSLVISSGSTLGTTSGNQHYLYVYALDNSGTVELAISQSLYSDYSIQSTSAEGGAGAADSNATIYSTTARSNVPIRLIGRISSTQTTAGTWATTPSEISLVSFAIAASEPVAAKYVISASTANSALTSGATEILDYDTKVYDTHGAVTTGASWKFTAPISGKYEVTARMLLNAVASGAVDNSVLIYAAKNGSSTIELSRFFYQTTSSVRAGVNGTDVVELLAGEYVQITAFQGSGSSANISTGTGACAVLIKRIGN